jgi:hypothetical protein
MNFLRRIELAVIVLALTASCSQLPQSSRTDEQMTSIRGEYLQNHPEGMYNAYIREGRVVKGMGIVEVLASWGLPNVRRPAPEGEVEFWAYYAKDEQTQRLVSYELVFEGKVLNRWTVHADLPSALGTTAIGADASRTVEETLRLGTGSPAQGSAPQKKRP